jgi:uncharacterized protein
MIGMEFEWDRFKAESNARKHGVTFQLAREAFLDINNFEYADEYPFEERTVLLGMADGVILYIVYTDRPPNIRLISARKAEKHEQDIYYHRNAP